MLKKLALLAVSLSVALVSLELAIRLRLRAWPLETALFVPAYLTERDAPLRWRFSPVRGRNSLGSRTGS